MPNTALNRTTAALLTNKSGGALVYGDVVVLDNTNANGFTTTTTSGLSSRGLGVILEPNGIANNASGMVATGGWIPKVTLNTAATVGQFIKTHTVAGQATPHSSPQVEGDFGVALDASATPSAILFGSPNQASTVIPTTIVIAASDESDSDNTLHNDAELLFAVSANSVYQFELVMMFTTGTSTTPDAQIGLTVPAGSTVTQTWQFLLATATATTPLNTFVLYQENPPTAQPAGVVSTATSSASPVVILGVLRTAGASGTLQVQWAQNTTTGGTPTVRKADSYLKVTLA